MRKFILPYAIVITIVTIGIIITDKLPARILATFDKKQLIKPESAHIILRNSLFKELHTTDKVIFVGNSITENGNWNELLQSDEIVNRGIAGDFSSGILKRIDQYINDRPRCIILMDGINDIMLEIPLDTIQGRYARIISKIQQAHIPVIVQSTLYVDKNTDVHNYTTSINHNVDALNKFLSEYCKARNIQFIDVNAVLQSNGCLASNYTDDGVHINGDAYEKWAKLLKPHLNSYL